VSHDKKLASGCPICGKPPVDRFAPFCSARCADVDLQRWLTGRYAIPAEPDEEHPDLELGDDHPGQARERHL
jgi:endogenous inhibitor of DNA gyrase (YacG/DUF329 family)